jgi:hypothetical protein
VLEPLALSQEVTGRFRDATANVAEAVSLATDLGQDLEVVVLTAISAWLAAVRGDVAAGQQQAHLVLRDTRHHEMAAAQATWALALIDLMAGDPNAALDRLEGICGGPPSRDVTVRAIPDHIEAGVRAGDTDRARRYLPTLVDWATHSKSPVATALVLRCEALLCDGVDARQRFEASLRVDGCGPYDRARTQVAYGEWLRRNRRRTSARAHLAEALATFERIGAHGWQRRVRDELIALGDPVADPPADAGGAGRLTPQELQVVRRAALGLSNREIAAELFLRAAAANEQPIKLVGVCSAGGRAKTSVCEGLAQELRQTRVRRRHGRFVVLDRLPQVGGEIPRVNHRLRHQLIDEMTDRRVTSIRQRDRVRGPAPEVAHQRDRRGPQIAAGIIRQRVRRRPVGKRRLFVDGARCEHQLPADEMLHQPPYVVLRARRRPNQVGRFQPVNQPLCDVNGAFQQRQWFMLRAVSVHGASLHGQVAGV